MVYNQGYGLIRLADLNELLFCREWDHENLGDYKNLGDYYNNVGV